MDRAVHRRSADSEQLGKLGCAVGPVGIELEQVLGLVRLQLRLLAAQPTLGFRHLHALRVRILIRSDSIMWTTLVCQAA